jgi:hypothetical protein
MSFFQKVIDEGDKDRAPPRDVVFIGLHTSICMSSQSLETLVASSLRKNVL